MNGKKVDIFLKTPLFRFRYLDEGKESQLMDNVIRVHGQITQEKEQGVVVSVVDLSNQKTKLQKKELPFSTIFIPFDKVDFMIIHQA